MLKYMNRMSRPGYYYKASVKRLDSKIVESGVNEVVNTVKIYLKKDFKNLVALDVGSGEGEFATAMAKRFKKVVGVEPFKEACEYAKNHIPKKIKNVSFVNSKIEQYKSKQRFDLITAVTIFEHLSDQKKAFDKIFSLLKKDGIIYITAPNKYWLFEQHYGFPFLSWLPLSIANRYLKLFTGVNSFADCSYARSYRYTKSFFDKYPCVYKFIVPFNIEGEYFGCGRKGIHSIVRKIGVFLIRNNPFFWNFSKGFIIVVKKTA